MSQGGASKLGVLVLPRCSDTDATRIFNPRVGWVRVAVGRLIFNQRRTLLVSALVDALAGQPVRLLTRFGGDPLERNALLGADFRENDSYEV